MVGDHHQVAGVVVGIGTAGGIADVERPDAQGAEYADGEGDLLHRVAFVVVETPFHGDDILVSEAPEDQFALVPLDRGDGEVRDVFVLPFLLDPDVARQVAQAGAEDYGRLGASCYGGGEKRGRLFYLIYFV